MILLQFIPSYEELNSGDKSNLYLKNLNGFYDSLQMVEKKLIDKFYELKTADQRDKFPDLEQFTNVSKERGEDIARNSPPEIAEYVLKFITPGGIGLAFYKILQLWVKSINGRKLRVKIGDIEIEATQLSLKQFNSLLSVIQDHSQGDFSDKEKKMFVNNLKKEEFVLFNSEYKTFQQKQELNEQKESIKQLKSISKKIKKLKK